MIEFNRAVPGLNKRHIRSKVIYVPVSRALMGHAANEHQAKRILTLSTRLNLGQLHASATLHPGKETTASTE